VNLCLFDAGEFHKAIETPSDPPRAWDQAQSISKDHLSNCDGIAEVHRQIATWKLHKFHIIELHPVRLTPA